MSKIHNKYAVAGLVTVLALFVLLASVGAPRRGLSDQSVRHSTSTSEFEMLSRQIDAHDEGARALLTVWSEGR